MKCGHFICELVSRTRAFESAMNGFHFPGSIDKQRRRISEEVIELALQLPIDVAVAQVSAEQYRVGQSESPLEEIQILLRQFLVIADFERQADDLKATLSITVLQLL